MKRLLIIIICLLCIVALVPAQRCIPGQKGLQLTAGLNDGYRFIKNRNKAFNVGFAFSTYSNHGNKWVYGLEYFEKQYCYKCHALPVVQFSGEAGYFYNLLANRGKDVFFNIGGSALIGYETSNWGKKVLPDGATLRNKDVFIGGGIITLEVETYVIDKLILMLHARERFCFGSKVGIYHFQIGIGIRYLIF